LSECPPKHVDGIARLFVGIEAKALKPIPIAISHKANHHALSYFTLLKSSFRHLFKLIIQIMQDNETETYIGRNDVNINFMEVGLFIQALKL